jgi:hypothetical protein
MRQVTLVILTLATMSGTAVAQSRRASARELDAYRSGLVLNVHAFATPGFSIEGPDIAGAVETSLGPGIGAQVGYAFSPRYMVFANIDLARLGAGDGLSGHWGLGIIEVGGRMSFPTANGRLMPYVAAAVGGRGLGAEVDNTGDVTFDGLAFSGGGGLTYALSRSLALDGGVMLSIGKFGNYDSPFLEGDLSVDNTMTTRIRFGLDWRP